MMNEEQQEIWAQIDEKNVVINVVVADKEYVDSMEGTFVFAGTNNELLATIGDTWNGKEFLSPKPFPSWILVDHVWVAPKPHPQVPNPMVWNEELKDWVDNPLHPNSDGV